MDFWARVGLASGILGLGLTFVSIFAPNLARKLPWWVSALGLGLGVTFSVASVALPFILPPEIKPNVILKLVEPRSPLLEMMNLSDAIAADIKQQVFAFNWTRFRENAQTLPVSGSVTPFLMPRVTSGPDDIFDSALKRSLIKNGDQILGSMSIHCRTCVRGHTYLFEIIWGESGWYAEVPEITNGGVLTPKHVKFFQEFVDIVHNAPLSGRVPIPPTD
jgi:hypothetical protein